MPINAFEKAKVDEWIAFSLMELDCLAIYTLRKHESPQRKGLSNLYGEAPNAVNAARKHFDKARQVSKQLLSFYRDLAGAFRGLNARIPREMDAKGRETLTLLSKAN